MRKSMSKGVGQRSHIRRTTWAAVAGAAMLVFVGARGIGWAQDGRDDHERACGPATLHGDYGVQVQGTMQLPDGTTESFIGVILRNYDGAGNLTQVDNVKGSVSGWVPDRPGSGTYEVNADCTGALQFEPAPGVIVETRIVIVDDGREIRTMTAVPQGNMVTGVEKRIHRR